MKAFPILLSALLLAACGKSEAPAEPAQNAAEAAPKPAFKVKYIDNNAIAGLDLGQSSEGKTNDGKKQINYPISGLSEQNVIQLIGWPVRKLDSRMGVGDGAGCGRQG